MLAWTSARKLRKPTREKFMSAALQAACAVTIVPLLATVALAQAGTEGGSIGGSIAPTASPAVVHAVPKTSVKIVRKTVYVYAPRAARPVAKKKPSETTSVAAPVAASSEIRDKTRNTDCQDNVKHYWCPSY